MNQPTVPLSALIAAAAIVVIWPTAFSVIKIGLEYFSPTALVVFRLITAAIAMLIYVTIKRYALPRGKDGWLIAISGLCGVAMYAFMLNLAIQTITAGQAAFLVAINPIFVVLMCRIFLGERFGIKTMTGMAVAVGGVAMLTLQGSDSFNIDIGSLFALLAGFGFSVYIMMQKPLLARYPADMVGAYSSIFSGALALLFLPSIWHEFSLTLPVQAYTSFLYLGLISSAAGFLVWAYTLSHLTRIQASTIVYLLPVSATIHAMWLLGEYMGPSTWLGGALVLLGVFIVNVRSAKKKVVSKAAA